MDSLYLSIGDPRLCLIGDDDGVVEVGGNFKSHITTGGGNVLSFDHCGKLAAFEFEGTDIALTLVIGSINDNLTIAIAVIGHLDGTGCIVGSFHYSIPAGGCAEDIYLNFVSRADTSDGICE